MLIFKYLVLLCCLIIASKIWAQNSETITVDYCIDPNWAPYESIENKQHQGISKLYLDLIEQYSPLRFNLITTHTWEQSLHGIKSSTCQLLPLLNTSAEREKFLTFSNIYFRAPNALYSHYDQAMVGNLTSITDQKVAVVAGYRMHDYLTRTFPNMHLVTVTNEQEGLVKVANQEVDYFVGSFYSANRVIQQLSLSQLRIAGIAEFPDKLRVGVAKDAQHLLPLINQAINKISTTEHNQIFNSLKMADLVKRSNYAIVLKTSFVLLLVTLALLAGFIYFRQQAKKLADKHQKLQALHNELADKNHQLAQLSIRDPLTNLYNRTHLAEVIEQQIKLKQRYDTSSCLLMIDIDDFKRINDKFGHKAGDEILIKFASTLTKCARDSDIVARWGGEEFSLLCPNTTPQEAEQIARRFQDSLMTMNTEQIQAVTCSIGIAELTENCSADDWFIVADNAMYSAKNQGKNKIIMQSNG
ncbi:diguanylate cyclase [Thalassotalea sp. G2M2-11]|uniref:diguanylate cyclase n=1 Tax=Thalassotalea sp. G2M2-11 TaxID=2787627 RepID=UPI0019D27FD9|nr:diguanylate cyclase [Thalassotalea sp. G2M2-11]